MRKVVSFKSKRDAESRIIQVKEFPTNVSANKTRSSPKCVCVCACARVKNEKDAVENPANIGAKSI